MPSCHKLKLQVPACIKSLSKFLVFNWLVILSLLFGTLNGVYPKTYKGAELRTNDSYLYGRFEVRMKSAAGSGLLSSFFTYHDPTVYPFPWNEIDIEILGRYANRIQYNMITPGQVNHVIDTTLAYMPHTSFHVYAFEWTPDYVAWLVDGFEKYRETGSHVHELAYPQKNMMNIWPPDYVSWVGSLNPVILPIYAYYDWVKYYEYTPGSGDNFTLQWSDNFDTWNQSRWSKGTHTWQGNLCDFIPENAVFQDGYLILCLTNESNIGYSGAAIIDQDVLAPYLVWARNYPGFVKVHLSEVLDPVSAQNPANYLIPPLTVNQARLLDDQRTVNLSVENLDQNQAYNLIVSGVKDLAITPNTMVNQIILTKPTPQFPIQINAGGNPWQNYLGDQIWTENKEYGRVDGDAIQLPDTLEILNTEEDTVFHSELRNLSFYEIRLPEGRYDITLQFAETQYNSPSGRLFDVYLEHQLMINDLNIFVEAGLQQNTAVEKVIPDFEVSEGILDLYFQASTGGAVLSGIKVALLTTGLKESTILPENFYWNLFPNPFNSQFTLQYQLQRSQEVKIQLYTIQGQLVRTLIWESQAAGVYTQRFQLPELSSGIYLITLEFDRRLAGVKKAVYLK